VLMALEMREAIGALTETWRRWGHEIGFGIGIAHGFATLGTIGFEGRFDYAAIGTVSNVASRLCDEAKPGQILISPRVLRKVEYAVKVEPVGEFELKGIRRPLAAYNASWPKHGLKKISRLGSPPTCHQKCLPTGHIFALGRLCRLAETSKKAAKYRIDSSLAVVHRMTLVEQSHAERPTNQ
jgi:hypothetical protein